MKIVIDMPAEMVARMAESEAFDEVELVGFQGGVDFSKRGRDSVGSLATGMREYPELGELVADCYMAVRKAVRDK